MNTARSILLFVLLLAMTGILAAAHRELADDQSWKAPDEDAKKTNPVAADDKSIAGGKQNYVKQCQVCHGPQGKGDGPMSSMLPRPPGDLSSAKVRDESDGELFWKISTGKNPMPTYNKEMSENERWDMVNFLRTLEPAPEKK